jgi:hypothetical protein
MDRLNRRRAKQNRSAEVRIEFVMHHVSVVPRGTFLLDVVPPG